jgi:hypothetical protein
MKVKLVIRAISAVFLGFLFGLYVHHDYMRWSQSGIDSFLSHEAVRFHKYMEIPQSEGHTLFTFAFAALLAAAMYELVVRCISALTKVNR